MGGGPGIGVAAAEWLVDRGPMLLGADNTPVEVSPNPDPELSSPVHQIMLVVNGIHLVERMKLDELASTSSHSWSSPSRSRAERDRPSHQWRSTERREGTGDGPATAARTLGTHCCPPAASLASRARAPPSMTGIE